MREIKFRGWSSEEHRFVGFMELEEHGWCDSLTNEHYPLVWQQFTGLKDENGKDIYEGDIVKHSYPAGYTIYQVKIGEFDNGESFEESEYGFGVFMEGLFEHYFVEKWKDQAYDKWLESEEKIKNCFGYPNISDTEVIGNIYENPELLESVNKNKK